MPPPERYETKTSRLKEGISRSGSTQFDDGMEYAGRQSEKPKINSINLVLDKAGAARTTISDVPKILTPQD
ncbi:hypothetical protein, partial [Escherichia coli]|uniref:hypothetical protein n=1 Tax=Escherichia coli TaxID=562 RepID=UPI0019D60097